jgi:TetR/AcrR family transcriptional repressor of mexJK operon
MAVTSRKLQAKRSAARRLPDGAKHDAILKAATRLFLKNGYSTTTMDAVADAARVTKQTVYAHYKSKDELFTQMISQLCNKHTPSKMALADGQKVETVLYQIGVGFLNMVTSPDGLAAVRLVVSEAKRHPRMAQLFYESGTQRMVTLLAELLKQYNKRGLLSVPNAESASSYFFAMLKGSYHLRMILCIKPVPTSKEKEAHVQETVRMFMALYGGKNPLVTRSKL